MRNVSGEPQYVASTFVFSGNVQLPIKTFVVILQTKVPEAAPREIAQFQVLKVIVALADAPAEFVAVKVNVSVTSIVVCAALWTIRKYIFPSAST